jgi:hypothetical protein
VKKGLRVVHRICIRQGARAPEYLTIGQLGIDMRLKSNIRDPGEAAEAPQLSDAGFEWSTVGNVEVYNSPICIV